MTRSVYLENTLVKLEVHVIESVVASWTTASNFSSSDRFVSQTLGINNNDDVLLILDNISVVSSQCLYPS